jgi:hypothetical protein
MLTSSFVRVRVWHGQLLHSYDEGLDEEEADQQVHLSVCALHHHRSLEATYTHTTHATHTAHTTHPTHPHDLLLHAFSLFLCYLLHRVAVVIPFPLLYSPFLPHTFFLPPCYDVFTPVQLPEHVPESPHGYLSAPTALVVQTRVACLTFLL